jgi:hypothetical protein
MALRRILAASLLRKSTKTTATNERRSRAATAAEVAANSPPAMRTYGVQCVGFTYRCAALSKDGRALLGSVVPSQSIRRSSQLLPRLRQHSRTAWRAQMGSREHRMAWPDGRRYMGTIGMAEIDYFVSDPQHIPPAYVVELSAAMRDACLSHLVPQCMRPKYCPVPCTLTPHRCATTCHSKAWQSTP